MSEEELEEALEQLVLGWRAEGVWLSEIIEVLEVQLEALREENDD